MLLNSSVARCAPTDAVSKLLGELPPEEVLQRAYFTVYHGCYITCIILITMYLHQPSVILYNISRCTEGEFEGLVAKLSTCHTVAVNYFPVHVGRWNRYRIRTSCQRPKSSGSSKHFMITGC